MTDEDICQYAEEIRNGKDPFSCWTHNYILNSLKEWKNVMYDFKHQVVTTMIFIMK